jgi:anthranilate/para-aminobenzoate synthase component II
MKFLKQFNEVKKILAYDEEVLKTLPSQLSIYTSDGSFTFNLGNSTRETDILRASYSRETTHKDGEPDTLSLDIHFMKNENGFKTIVDIIYGDNIKHQISIESPNKVSVGYYNGVGSVNDPSTQFGFEDISIRNLCKFFNNFNFGYNLKPDDLKSIDKYPNSYKHPVSNNVKSLKFGLKNSFNKGDEIILVIDNSKPPGHNYLNNVLNYLKYRGEKFETVSSIEEFNKVNSEYKIVGAISTGSDYRASKDDSGSELQNECYKKLKCPILGLCFGFQSMCKLYGGSIIDSNDYIHKHLKLTNFNQNHFLFSGLDLQGVEFSFSFHDIIEKIPNGFKQIAMLNDIIVGISDEERKRHGLLFHPEDKEMTYPVLDNFIGECRGKKESDEQRKIQSGKFEKLLSFKNFTK